MNDYVILPIEQLKTMTSISDNIDVEMLEPYLFIAQQRYIRPLVGDALMDAITADQQSGGTAYQTLVQDYLWYALAYATWNDASIFMAYKTHKKGVVKQGGDNSENLNVEEMSIYTSRIRNNMTFYLDRAKDYLNDNKSVYPLYNSTDQRGESNSSSIFLDF
jgi:hypothetical protein